MTRQRVGPWLLALACISALSACGGSVAEPKKPADLVPNCAAPCEVEVVVDSPRSTNGGGSVQLLIRVTTEVGFEHETYQELVGTLQAPADDRMLEWKALLPGEPEYRKTVPYPADGTLAVYFLFSRPLGRWRYRVDPQMKAVRFELGPAEIHQVTAAAR